MNLLHFCLIAFLLGIGSCELEKSPDQLFYFHVAKLRTRVGKINITEIVGLIKNGSEVAGKVQGVFEKIQKLKDGPVNTTELMELGKEVYDVGKQAYTVGKEAYEIGKNVFEVSKGFLEKHEALLQVGKTMGKTLASITKNLGPALGGVGIAFAFITMFMAKDDSPELAAIKNGFKEMHQRFDQVTNQISALESKIDFYQAIKPYQEVRDNLENVYRKYVNLADVPTSAGYKKIFQEACMDHKIEPMQALEKLRRIIVNPGPEDQPHMLKAIITHHKMDYKAIMGWFERITQNAYTLAVLRSACFGALHGSEDEAQEHSLNQTETWVRDIIGELAKHEEKFTSLEPEYLQFIENELKNLPATFDAASEAEINERCDKWEKELTKSNELCRTGNSKLNARRIAVNKYLNTKYYWLNWFVAIYQGAQKIVRADSNDNDYDVQCDTPKGSHWLLVKSGDHTIFVSWSRRDAFVASQLREQAYEKLDKGLKEIKPRDMESTKVVSGITIYYNDKMNKWMKWWMSTIKYENKTMCHVAGHLGTYQRTVFTSGVGAHRALTTYPYMHNPMSMGFGFGSAATINFNYITDYFAIFW